MFKTMAARDADALYAKGGTTKRMIDWVDHCKIIALGSVGVDSVECLEGGDAKGIPVTNCPDTFIDQLTMR